MPGDSGNASPTGATSPSSGSLPLPKGETEATLLSKLLQLLGARPGGTMLLDDLLNLMPRDPQQAPLDMTELNKVARSWLENFPSLLLLSGSGPSQCVTLRIANSVLGTAVPPASGGNPAETGAQLAEKRRSAGLPNSDQATVGSGSTASADYATRCAVQLRGLPFKAQIDDIKAFLSKFGAHVQEEGGINIILTKSSQPSGYALIKFKSPDVANEACLELHGKTMSVVGPGGEQHTRYIEVFSATDKIDKGRNKAMLLMANEDHKDETNGNQGTNSSSLRGSSNNLASKATESGSSRCGQERLQQERLLSECRNHMTSIEGYELLLSMLGVALSQESRTFLKKSNRGLKYFLAQCPEEFAVEGQKGQERVIYLPNAAMAVAPQQGLPLDMTAMMHCHQYSMAMIPTDFSALPVMQAPVIYECPPLFQAAPAADPPAPLPQTRRTEPPESPVPTRRAPVGPTTPTPRENRESRDQQPIGTPSNWGTPFASPDVRHQVRISQLLGDPASPPKQHPKPVWENDISEGMPRGNGSWLPDFLQMPSSGAGDWSSSLMWPSSPPFLSGILPPPFPSDGMDTYLMNMGGGKIQSNDEDMCGKLRDAQASPCMGSGTELAGANLVINGLPDDVTTKDVFALFSEHRVIEGVADNVRIRGAKRSMWTQAIVEMKTHADAQEAKKALNGTYMGEAQLEVSILPLPANDNSKEAALGMPPWMLPNLWEPGNVAGSGSCH